MKQEGKGRTHGQIDYVQLPALDIERSAAFYEKAFGWSIDTDNGSFEAPGMIGQLTTDQSPAATGGPVLWISADDLSGALKESSPTVAKCMGGPNLMVASDGL